MFIKFKNFNRITLRCSIQYRFNLWMKIGNNNLLTWLKRKKRILTGLATISIITLMVIIVDFNLLIRNVIIFGLWGILIFIMAYTITFILRALKLKLIFKGLGVNISYSNSYYSIGVSFAINESTPAKLGDLTKIGLLKDQEDIKLSESLCGITIERVMDLIVLFSFSCIALFYLYFGNFNESEAKTLLGYSLEFYVIIGTIILVFVLIFLIILIFQTEIILKIISKITPNFANILESVITNFKEGLYSFRNNKKDFSLIIIIQIILWFIEVIIGAMFFLILIEGKYHLNLFIIIIALVITYFSKTIPITPGGWGISENLGALFIFIFYPEIPFTLILSIFIIEHLFRSSYVFIYGGISMIHYNFKFKDIEKIKVSLT